MNIGEIIAKRRKESNFSQEQLAEAAEISQSYISRIELGKEKPSFELLERIAVALNCELFIDLVPIGEQRRLFTPDEYPVEDNAALQTSTPTWLTLENARALTIFGIAYQKLEIEKETLKDSERKALEGIIETCKGLLSQEE